jgi:hypothetical protein
MNIRKLNKPFKPRRDDILRLRKQGLSYRAIAKKLGCSKGTISFHCSKSQTERNRVRKQNKSYGYNLSRKVNAFKSKCSRTQYITFRNKVKGFKRRKAKLAGGGNREYAKAGTTWRIHNLSKNYSARDVINKIGESPVCYLTGRKIDLSCPSEYSLDHRLPTAQGGTNDLDNLEICTIVSNRAKADLTLEDFYALCEEVLAWRDKGVNP